MHRNTVLYENVRAYATAAIDLVNNDPNERCTFDNWSNSPGIILGLSHDKLKLLPEYIQCQKDLLNDSVIASQLGTLLGVASYRYISPTPESIMLRLPQLGIYQNELKFNPDYFEREYNNFEAAFYGVNVIYEVIVPVARALFKTPIKLDENLEICLVTSNDLTLVLSGKRNTQSHELMQAIRAEYTLPKISASEKARDLKTSRKDRLTRNRINSLIDSVIACLRVFGIENVNPIANIHRTKSILFEHAKPFMVKPAPNTDFCWIFDKDNSPEFIKFWREYNETITKYKFIGIAVDRCSYTYERHTQEDQIIDLLIAAEALFLSQINTRAPQKAQPLGARAAAFLSNDKSDKKKIEEDFRIAYKLRNMIVHGNSKLAEEIKNVEAREEPQYGDDLKFDQFIHRIRNYIRFSIAKMVSIAESIKDKSQRDEVLVDWNSLIKSTITKK